MKKNNILLAICSFIAVSVYMYYFVFDIIPGNEINMQTLLYATANWLFLITFVLCFFLKNRTMLLLCILLSSGFGVYVCNETVYSYFPLFMSIWFVKTVEKKPSWVELIPYFIGALTAIISGTFLIFNNGRVKLYGANLTKLRIVIFSAMALVLVSHCVIALVNRNKKEKKQPKTKQWGKRLENYKVAFYFAEAFLLVLAIAFFMKIPFTDSFKPVFFAVYKAVVIVYCVLKLHLIGGGEIGFLTKLKKQWLS